MTGYPLVRKLGSLYGLNANGGCERFVSKGTHFCQNCVPFLRTPRMKKCVPLTSKSAYPWRGTQNYLNVRIFNRQPALDLIRLPEAIELRKPSQNCPVRACGGDSWTRTNDPIDVNDVLYRLSHATLFRTFKPTPYEMFGSFIRLFAYPVCEQFARQLGTASHERKHGLMF